MDAIRAPNDEVFLTVVVNMANIESPYGKIQIFRLYRENYSSLFITIKVMSSN